jgi:hypothetical protein
MNMAESKYLSATMVGAVQSDYNDKYTYSSATPDIVEVVQNKNTFYLKGLSAGITIVTVNNEYADFPRKMLVIVDGTGSMQVAAEKYISTSQNVIQMEVGGDTTLLKMALVGGIEADRNGFSWTVSDSSIIEVASNSGVVKNTRRVRRSVVDNEWIEKLVAEAVITAKKVGTATITVANTNSENNTTVLVKVYPRGTFNTAGVDVYNTGVYRVEAGGEKAITLWTSSGTGSIGDVIWEVEDTAIAAVTGTGLNGVLEGFANGITYLTVKGGNLRNPFKQVVIVGDDAYVKSIKYFYINGVYKNIGIGHNLIISIDEINLQHGENTYSVVNTRPDVVEATVIGNRILLQGMSRGEAVLTVSDTVVGITNDLYIKVDESNISVDTPYYISGDTYVGVVVGGTVQFPVSLVGAPEAEKGKLIWATEDGAVAGIVANGEEARIEGKSFGQTKITVGHAKSENTKEIVVYVVKNASDLLNNVLLGSTKLHYLIRKGIRNISK